VVGVLHARARLRTLLGASAPAPGLRADVLLVAALLAAGLALLGPRAGQRTEHAIVSGVDLVVLFDVSRSMDARDTPPSRLERAVRVAGDVLAGLGPGDRSALAAFAGRGVLLTPLTPDASALREMLSGLDSELMQRPGSELGAGVREALTAFQEGSDRPRVVLVLSDGEAPLGQDSADLGIPDAVRAGARIVAVGFGTEAGATVPDHGVPLLDGSGRVVVSRRDAGRLAILARETGGVLAPTDAFGGVDLAHLLGTLRRDAPRAPGVPIERRVPRRWAWPFAALAFVLLLCDAVSGFGRLGRRRGASLAIAALTAFYGLGLVPAAETAGPGPSGDAPPPEMETPLPAESLSLDELEARARERPADPLVLLRLGLARSREGLPEDAARAYLAAGLHARDSALAALAWYDLGVTELALGDLPGARDAFFDALALEPHEPHTQFNLEWTLRAIAEHVPPPPHAGGSAKRAGEEGNPPERARKEPGGKGTERRAQDRAPGSPPSTEDKARRAGREPGEEAPRGEPPQGVVRPPGDAARAGSAPAMSPEQARLWLANVTEEPGHALRQAARRHTRGTDPGSRPAPGGPSW
jgi:Ca-activated chloride channel family protein